MVPQFRGDDTEEDLFRKALLMSEREEEERKRREALYDDALERAVQMVNSTPTAVNGTVLVPTMSNVVLQVTEDDTEEEMLRKALLMSEREEEERKRREALYDDAMERAVQMVNSTPTVVNGTVLVPTMSNVVLQVTEDDTEEEMLRKALLVSERVEEERKQREALESTAIAVVLGLSLQSVESTVDEELLAVIRLSERGGRGASNAGAR